MKIKLGSPFQHLFEQFPFFVIDVGARGGLKKEWFPLKRYMKLICFEPDPQEYQRLVSTTGNDPNTVYYNSALWDSKTEVPLHVTRLEGFSSAHLPNDSFLKHFGAENIEGYTLERTITMSADKLDNVLPPSVKENIDFMKVDVEGCAFQVLKGSEETLAAKNVFGLKVEAELNEKFTGQYLFSDVDKLLRKYRYQLFDAELCRWKRKAGLKTGGLQGQLIHGDFIYFMDLDVFFKKIDSLELLEKRSKVVKYLVFLCLHGIYDVAYELVGEASKNEMLPRELTKLLENQLRKSRRILMRIPKLKGRGVSAELFYHAFMLVYGVWLERAGYWKPTVELEVSL